MIKTGNRYRYACPVESQRFSRLDKGGTAFPLSSDVMTTFCSTSIHSPGEPANRPIDNNKAQLSVCNQAENSLLNQTKIPYFTIAFYYLIQDRHSTIKNTTK